MREETPVIQFIAYLVNEEEKGYLYASKDGEYFRVSSPTSEDSYIVIFNSRTEMLSDLRAMKCLCDDMVCFHREDLTPINFMKIRNVMTMLSSQERLSYRRMCA